MAHKTRRQKHRLASLILGIVIALILLPILFYIIYRVKFNHTVFPRIYVVGELVSGLNEAQVQDRVTERVNQYFKNDKIILRINQQYYDLPLNQIQPQYNPAEIAFETYAFGRTGPPIDQIRKQWLAVTQGQEIIAQAKINEMSLEVWLATLSAQVTSPMIPPRIEVDKQKQVKVLPGQSGTALQIQAIKEQIQQRLDNFSSDPIEVKLDTVEAINDPKILEQAKVRAEAMLNKKLELTVDDPYISQSWKLNGEEMINLMQIGKDFDQIKIAEYLAAVKEGVDRPAQDAKFVFKEETKKVEEFVPAKNGLSLEIDESVKALSASLEAITNNEEATTAALVVSKVSPAISLDNANSLGIIELLGRGTSTYKGSIQTRVHNVALAASRINGTLVKPGETFSFNQAVGEVSSATGYQQAYIIRNGRTELGDGGGVCQDSTTTFRAALDAGLPIIERRAHAYRVGYYEQDVKAGIDATVYAPSPDFKFTNDTPAHLLIQAKADTPKRALTVEIYGTSDGRKSEIKNHTVWDITPPPPDVFQDDPTLKTGEVKQVDWKAGGAKAKFDYLVTRNGETIYEKTFYSTYKPWAAVFLRGTGQ